MFTKKDPNIIVAVEIGTHKVVAAVAELEADGSLILHGLGESETVGLRKGEVVDFAMAQQSVKNALIAAEEQTDIQVGEVYLSLSGAHIESKNVELETQIDTEGHQIEAEHIMDLRERLERSTIPRDYAIVHDLLQHYYLDNGNRVEDPLSLSSTTLKARYHRVYGLLTRLQTTARCVQDLGLEVKGYALSSYASAQAALDGAMKKSGALVIDMGAGVTDYIVYSNGAVVHSGALGVGGDHLTNDLSCALRVTYKQAERLKIEYGNLFLDECGSDEQIVLAREMESDERSIYVDSMVKVLHCRQKEMLELIAQDIEDLGLWPSIGSGVILTGGASRMRGLARLARDVFPGPVRSAQVAMFGGDQTYHDRQDLMTVLGLLRYAQKLEESRPRKRGIGRLTSSIRDMLASMRIF